MSPSRQLNVHPSSGAAQRVRLPSGSSTRTLYTWDHAPSSSMPGNLGRGGSVRSSKENAKRSPSGDSSPDAAVVYAAVGRARVGARAFRASEKRAAVMAVASKEGSATR
ncbi:MAG: hypothetical protein U0325_01845 [Polyangiales bacterium]